ncbi:phosphotransferase [Paenibacillus dauci]|uniref:phosphotransferase n=1 Tax=Paenibacillus dauci TaxID=1567106 RepID=UPI000619F0EC|nr:phosphotransferase [Paenibacillus dauci]
MQWTAIVTRQGQLHREWTTNIEVLYTGLHGLSVQRFQLKENGQSYIYKPFVTVADVIREVRVYQQVMPWLPEVYPQLIAYSTGVITETMGNEEAQAFANQHAIDVSASSGCWLILEDIGTLSHHHNEQVLLEMVNLMAQWHRIPIRNIQELPVQGQKPPLSAVKDEVLQNWEQAVGLLNGIYDAHDEHDEHDEHGQGMEERSGRAQYCIPDPQKWDSLRDELRQFAPEESPVLSHGDLHAGNYGLNPEGRLIVLDWEHAHAALPYWDLYHLLDMSHPLFPRRMNPTLRQKLLQQYWQQTRQTIQFGEQDHRLSLDCRIFYQDYYRFAILYSLWMLLLIERDLLQPQAIWPHPQLLAQRRETMEHLWQCIEHWPEL